MSLFEQLQNNLDNFDNIAGSKSPFSSGVGGGLHPQKGNPAFKTQIDLDISLCYSTVSFDPVTGTSSGFNSISPSSIKSFLKVPLPVYMFGNSDFASGYKRCNQITPTVGGWQFNSPQIVKGNSIIHSFSRASLLINVQNSNSIDVSSKALQEGKASRGDLILCFYNVTSNSSESFLTVAEVIIKCPQVGYGTLLDSISSDTFKIDGIRYSVNNVTKISQFANQFDMARQSMFGKMATDSINPNSMKLPTNQQDNIIDVPLILGIDKNQMFNTYINHDCDSFKLSLFIPAVTKIKA